MKICCISDTHEMHRSIVVPKSDVLLHAGDLTFRGDPAKVVEFNQWCRQLLQQMLVREIICIAGNHDFIFEDHPTKARSLLTAVTYLEDSEAVVAGIKCYGTPWQPWFFDWAFNLRTEKQLKAKFDRIPEGTQILICHSPPRGILDANTAGEHCGSAALLDAVYRVRPKLVVFGHIHEAYGMLVKDGMTFVNASTCTLDYKPVNPPIVVEL